MDAAAAYRLVRRRGRPWEPAAVLAGVVAIAAIVALLLTPGPRDFDGVTSDPAQVQIDATGKPPSPLLRRARSTPTAVLSAVSVPRIAARTGARLRGGGFRISAVADAPAPRPRSVVLYAGGEGGPARALARSLGIERTARLDSATQAVAPATRLSVVLGGDRR